MTAPTPTLTPEQLEAFGQELDAIRAGVVADLGKRDVDYINRLIRVQRGLEVAGRGLLFAGFLPPAWLGGTAALSLSKILDNMEIGHNVMHGQYDWTGDERLNGKTFEWDTACPADQWRHSHNYMHHTHTNIVGKDRDIGYGILRMSEDEPWRPYYLGNPLYAALLASFFQYGVAMHDVEAERIAAGESTLDEEKREKLQAIWRKVKGQTLKDYVLFPLLSGPSFPFVLAGNATANLTRNLWAFTIIFCGHFPDGTEQFTEEETENETRGEWYYRQMLGSANLTGGKLFHILAGNLSYQIEHHLFPDLPAHRYGEISEEVREIRERYGIPYNTGPLHRQFGSVVRKIVKLALPPLPGLRGSEPSLDEPAAPTRPRTPAPTKTGPRKLAAAKTGPRKPTAAKTSTRKLATPKAGPRALTSANASLSKPAAPRTGPRKPVPTKTGPRRLTAPKTGPRKPAAAKTSPRKRAAAA